MNHTFTKRFLSFLPLSYCDVLRLVQCSQCSSPYRAIYPSHSPTYSNNDHSQYSAVQWIMEQFSYSQSSEKLNRAWEYITVKCNTSMQCSTLKCSEVHHFAVQYTIQVFNCTVTIGQSQYDPSCWVWLKERDSYQSFHYNSVLINFHILNTIVCECSFHKGRGTLSCLSPVVIIFQIEF